MPLAMPALLASTTARAVEAIPGFVMPMPIPASTKPGSSVVQPPSDGDPFHQDEPDPTRISPVPISDPRWNSVREPGRERRDDEREQRQG